MGSSWLDSSTISTSKSEKQSAPNSTLTVAGEMTLHGLADVSRLLPPLPAAFSAAELQKALGRRGRTLWRAVRCLEESGAITRLPKEGRAVTYRK